MRPILQCCAVVVIASGLPTANSARAQGLSPDRGPGSPITIDGFGDLSQWTSVPSDGVSLAIASDSSDRGRSMRLDFDFNGSGGYAVAHRKVSIDFPADYELAFDVRGLAPSENVEVKLIDASGENVWWVNRRDYVFHDHWTRFTIKRRQISFAWGPRGGGELTHAAALEIAITAGRGGKGSVWIGNLTLESKPPVSRHPPALRATSANSAVGSSPNNAVDGNIATAWRSNGNTQDTLTIDLGAEREFGGMSVAWDTSERSRDYDVELSDDGQNWKTAYQLRNGAGGRDELYMPESESHYVRLALRHSSGGAFRLREVALRPLAWSESLNAFYFAIAKGRLRGSFPRTFTDSVQTYWTVVGAPAASRNALVSEDGAVEVGKAQFSLEPFIYDDGQLITWANVRVSQSLARGELPIPSVRWSLAGRAASLALTTTAWVAGVADSATLYVRYSIANRGVKARHVTLFVALRPFQVNGPFQFLNGPGGAAIVRSVRYNDGVVHLVGPVASETQTIVPLTPPTSFGASTFDAGGAIRSMRIGRVPAARAVTDSTGRADAALSYVLNVSPGGTRDVVIAVPFSKQSDLRPMRPDSASTLAARELARTADEWVKRLGHIEMHLPVQAAWLARTLRSQQAYILINEDGPRIQPGSRSYARSWIRDGALTSEALLRTGHADRVAAFLDWYAPFQYPNGKIPCCVDHRGADPVPEHDSNGEFLYLVRQLYRYTGDSARLQRAWPYVARAVSYLDSLRHLERVPSNRAPDKLLFYGLLPPSISHEGYSAKPMHSYWDDFWALRGFRDATAIAAVLGNPNSIEFATISREFETDLLASINAAMRDRHIDFIPGSADLGDFDATSTTIALEPGGVQSVLPQPALANTFDRYWHDAMARTTGHVQWQDYTPYELRTVGSFVRLGEPERAHALLRFFREGQRPAAWNAWAEVVRRNPRAPGFIGDMPHTWVGSDFIRSLLDMFVYENQPDGTLVVGAGIPEEWARTRGGAGAAGIRTPYGSLTVNERVVERAVRVTLSGLIQVPTGGIAVHAPFPMRPRSATVNGARSAILQDGVVMIKALPSTIDFFK